MDGSEGSRQLEEWCIVVERVFVASVMSASHPITSGPLAQSLGRLGTGDVNHRWIGCKPASELQLSNRRLPL